MTIDDPLDQLGKDSEPQKQKPFQVVLVDIKKAAHDRMIYCVKKPLEEKDLEYVALSYRWGEIHETLMDTEVGYTASITSFELNDFYKLCKMMTFESDMQHIKYVWVDAICVDQRPSKRKATIYKMSTIYERATYILAVPDLHLAYLKEVSIKNKDTIEGSNRYCHDIYHLIHGNTSKLAELDEKFLNHCSIPQDSPALRQLLFKYTDQFADAFMKYQKKHYTYCPMRALYHISETNKVCRHHLWQTWIKGSSKTSIDELHQCHEEVCPLLLFGGSSTMSNTLAEISFEAMGQFIKPNWISKIIQRSTVIQQSVNFLADLIKDWSSRVWVISEYNIAKKKNNLKYWFIQLELTYLSKMTYNDMDEKFTFFKFDFDDSSFSNDILYTTYYSNQEKTITSNSETSNPVYIRFHYTMIHQLSQRTFLEMILGSKASRNEDRFYSTLPLSEYQERKSEVSHWKISSMISVKLKLYEIMNIKDKMILLFWSINKHALTNGVLPTFATSTLPLDFQMRRLADDIDRGSCNFDLDDQAAILLQQTNNNNKDDDDDDDDDDGGSNLYYLRLKPKGYFMVWTSGRKFPQPHMNAHTCKRLGINTETVIKLDVVYIPAFDDTILDTGTTTVVLVGSFDRNKWVITEQYNDYLNSFDNYHRCTHSSTVSINQLPFFNVY